MARSGGGGSPGKRVEYSAAIHERQKAAFGTVFHFHGQNIRVGDLVEIEHEGIGKWPNSSNYGVVAWLGPLDIRDMVDSGLQDLAGLGREVYASVGGDDTLWALWHHDKGVALEKLDRLFEDPMEFKNDLSIENADGYDVVAIRVLDHNIPVPAVGGYLKQRAIYSAAIHEGQKQGLGLVADCMVCGRRIVDEEGPDAIHYCWRCYPKRTYCETCWDAVRVPCDYCGETMCPDCFIKDRAEHEAESEAFSAAVHVRQREAVLENPILQDLGELRVGDIIEDLTGLDRYPGTLNYGLVTDILEEDNLYRAFWMSTPEEAEEFAADFSGIVLHVYSFIPGRFRLLKRGVRIKDEAKFSAAVHKAQRAAVEQAPFIDQPSITRVVIEKLGDKISTRLSFADLVFVNAGYLHFARDVAAALFEPGCGYDDSDYQSDYICEYTALDRMLLRRQFAEPMDYWVDCACSGRHIQKFTGSDIPDDGEFVACSLCGGSATLVDLAAVFASYSAAVHKRQQKAVGLDEGGLRLFLVNARDNVRDYVFPNGYSVLVFTETTGYRLHFYNEYEAETELLGLGSLVKVLRWADVISLLRKVRGLPPEENSYSAAIHSRQRPAVARERPIEWKDLQKGDLIRAFYKGTNYPRTGLVYSVVRDVRPGGPILLWKDSIEEAVEYYVKNMGNYHNWGNCEILSLEQNCSDPTLLERPVKLDRYSAAIHERQRAAVGPFDPERFLVVKKPHPMYKGNVYLLYRFPNGYSASVIHMQYTTGGVSGLWEIGVTHLDGGWATELDFVKEGIIDDLISEEVPRYLKRIYLQPPYKEVSYSAAVHKSQQSAVVSPASRPYWTVLKCDKCGWVIYQDDYFNVGIHCPIENCNGHLRVQSRSPETGWPRNYAAAVHRAQESAARPLVDYESIRPGDLLHARNSAGSDFIVFVMDIRQSGMIEGYYRQLYTGSEVEADVRELMLTYNSFAVNKDWKWYGGTGGFDRDEIHKIIDHLVSPNKTKYDVNEWPRLRTEEVLSRSKVRAAIKRLDAEGPRKYAAVHERQRAAVEPLAPSEGEWRPLLLPKDYMSYWDRSACPKCGSRIVLSDNRLIARPFCSNPENRVKDLAMTSKFGFQAYLYTRCESDSCGAEFREVWKGKFDRLFHARHLDELVRVEQPDEQARADWQGGSRCFSAVHDRQRDATSPPRKCRVCGYGSCGYVKAGEILCCRCHSDARRHLGFPKLADRKVCEACKDGGR